jgi:hypothetical protein
MSSREGNGLPPLEEIDGWTNIPAISPNWVDEDRTGAGSEGFVIKRTMSEPISRALVENAGVCLHSVTELIVSAAVDKPPEEQMVNSICWQAIRDLKSSIYLAMSGRYRSAFVVQRGVIEIVGSAVYFAKTIEQEGESGWELLSDWLNGEKDASPSFRQIQGVLSDIVPWLSESIYTSMREDRNFGNRHVHTPIGGDPLSVLFGEREMTLIRPWSASYDLETLQTWYVSFITDVWYIVNITVAFFDSVSVSRRSFNYIMECYRTIADRGTVHGLITDVTIELPNMSGH